MVHRNFERMRIYTRGLLAASRTEFETIIMIAVGDRRDAWVGLSSRPEYWVVPAGSDASIFGPYVNHDHYAGLMEILAPLALTLSLSGLVQGGQRVLAAFGAIIMAGSIVLSLSRGGTISLLGELLILVLIVSGTQRGALARTRIFSIVMTLLAFLAFIGSSVMWQHLGNLKDAVRLDILRDSLRMFAVKPFLGWGFGTFQDVYPSFRSFYTSFFVNAAHNDYLQVLVETGLAGFGCVVWFIILLYRNGLRRLDGGNQTWRGVLAALVGCTGILVHSLFDFNLQIPANAALFYVFCALVSSLPQIDVSRRKRLGASPDTVAVRPRRFDNDND